MKPFIQALLSPFQYWQVLLITYLVNLLAALPLVFFPALLLLEPARRPMIQEAAKGIEGWMLIETLLSPVIKQHFGLVENFSAAQQATLVGLAWLLIIPLFAGFTNGFLNGGLYLTAHENKFSWQRFTWGCWHWLLGFNLFAFVQFIIALALYSVWLTLISFTTFMWWLTVPVFVLFIVFWQSLMELTSAQMIVLNTRNAGRALIAALQTLMHRPAACFLFYGLVTFLLIIVHTLFNLILVRLPLANVWLVLLAQQTFMIVRLGVRIIRGIGSVTLTN